MHMRSKKINNKPAWQVIAGLIGVILVLGGIYTIVLFRAPYKPALPPEKQQSYLGQTNISSGEQLIIPKISLNLPISNEGMNALKTGAWHRFAERGDPETGGNMILAAHRYVFSYAPTRVAKESFFYNLPQLKPADKVYVDWHGQRHSYKITQILQVKPDQTSIEESSDTPKLTIYTCNLAGSADGRVVVIAEPELSPL